MQHRPKNKRKKSYKNILLLCIAMSIYVLSLYVYINFKSRKTDRIADTFASFEKKIVENDTPSGELDIKIPIVGNMVPQGITVVQEYILISAYDYQQNSNSLVYVLNNDGYLINICKLDIKSHVGGIAYDEKNKILWVAGSYGNVNAYDIKDIFKRKQAYSILEFYVGTGLSNYKNDEMDLISSLTVKDDLLFVGSFSLNNSGLVKKYRIVINNLLAKLNYIDEFRIPNKVQGLAFYKNKDRDYILFSISYGRKNASKIEIYSYDKNINDYTSVYLESYSFNLPPMLEQIWIKNDYLYAVYESNAKIYDDCPNKSENISIINIKGHLQE